MRAVARKGRTADQACRMTASTRQKWHRWSSSCIGTPRRLAILRDGGCGRKWLQVRSVEGLRQTHRSRRTSSPPGRIATARRPLRNENQAAGARFEGALIRLPLDRALEDVEHALLVLQLPRAPVGAGNRNDAMDRKVLRACGRGVHNGLNPRALGAFPTDGYRRDSSRYRWPRLRLRMRRVVHDDGPRILPGKVARRRRAPAPVLRW